MDPAHHHVTSEYVHGHEYDTYHYEDKKHQQKHFTVTVPEPHDMVAKGAYFHAHPEQVTPSYAHHEIEAIHHDTVVAAPVHHDVAVHHQYYDVDAYPTGHAVVTHETYPVHHEIVSEPVHHAVVTEEAYPVHHSVVSEESYPLHHAYSTHHAVVSEEAYPVHHAVVSEHSYPVHHATEHIYPYPEEHHYSTSYAHEFNSGEEQQSNYEYVSGESPVNPSDYTHSESPFPYPLDYTPRQSYHGRQYYANGISTNGQAASKSKDAHKSSEKKEQKTDSAYDGHVVLHGVPSYVEPVVHETIVHDTPHLAYGEPVVHHAVVHHAVPDDHNVERLDMEHHMLHDYLNPYTHESDLGSHYALSDWQHGHHHDEHYDAEHFYDGPTHHGGLHGVYVDPMAHHGGHSFAEDEHHVPHFTPTSEEPLTHTEEYYYGAPIHHFHHDYHHTDVSHSCWKKAYGRTAGEPLSTCPKDKEKDGALCYPYCEKGYSGVGPVCWQNCPHDKGFRDDGAYCYKPDAYGRGAGQVHECQGCEKWGSLWYPKCHDHFHNVGCCVCSPDCPKGMTDIGISCAKDSYSRTAGTPLTCKPGTEQNGALCYPPCDHKATGVGPVCWGKCPPSTKECGALCLGEDEICSEYIADEVKVAYQLTMDAAEHTTQGTVIDIAHVGSEITFPNCPNW